LLSVGTEAQTQKAGAAGQGGLLSRWLTSQIDRDLIDAFRWLQREYLRPHHRALALAFLLTWLAAGATALLVWLVKPALSAILAGGRIELVFGLAAAVAALGPVSGFATLLMKRIEERVGQAVLTHLQGDLFRDFLHSDLRSTAEMHTGLMLNLCNSEAGRAVTAATTVCFTMVQDLILFLCLAAVMLSLDWPLSLLALSALPLIAFGLTRMGRRVRDLTEEHITIGRAISTRLADVLAALRFVKASDTADLEVSRHRELTKRRKRIAVALAQTKATTDPLVGCASGGVIALVILVAAFRVADGGSEAIGGLAAFLVSVLVAYRPVRRLSTSVLNLQTGLIAAQRIRSALDARVEVRDRPNAVPLTARRCTVEISDVRFSYDGKVDVLRGVSMTLGAGEIVALVGPSGGGKSTLLNLIPRLYDPSAGVIAINGIDSREFRLSSLRRSIGVVGQDAILLDDTIRGNLTYGSIRPDDDAEDEERLWAALNDASALNFVRQLPKGLDTPAGERGKCFSGGQRQRLVLARALYRDASILLLDEPTSSLDRSLEYDVRATLTRLAGKKTILIVSHRLPIVEFADRIYVMLKGEIVEQGTHAELMRREGGVYPQLFGIQDLERTLGMSLTT
jgi:ATP-binding cassette, subfamily B, bacterial MsbA